MPTPTITAMTISRRFDSVPVEPPGASTGPIAGPESTGPGVAGSGEASEVAGACVGKGGSPEAPGDAGAGSEDAAGEEAGAALATALGAVVAWDVGLGVESVVGLGVGGRVEGLGVAGAPKSAVVDASPVPRVRLQIGP